MNSNDLTIIRRKKEIRHYLGYNKPLMVIQMPKGTFIFYKKAMELLNATHGDALMFAFNKSKSYAYVYKESPEIDSYYLHGEYRAYGNFSNKQLMKYFIDFFNINKAKSVYFEISGPEPQSKYFKISLIKWE